MHLLITMIRDKEMPYRHYFSTLLYKISLVHSTQPGETGHFNFW